MPKSPHADETLQATFSSRSNSLGFLRWFFAALVIVDHTYPIGGFHGGEDPFWQWSSGQDSLGGIAVAGFFIISGFLITRSRMGSTSTVRYLWHRVLRIFPGFWACLLVTACALSPLAWRHERGGLTGVFRAGPNGPLSYLRHNLWLTMHQYGIAGLLLHTPFGKNSGGAWDGSLWTLIYEFKCYLLVALLGAVGILPRYRGVVVALTLALYGVTLSYLIDPSWEGRLMPMLTDPYVARYTFLFMLGSLCALYASRIPIDNRLGLGALLVMLWSLHYGGWFLVGYPAFAYLLIVLAVRLPIRSFDRPGDFSYGIYIYAFPIQMLLAEYSLQRHGGPVLFALVSLGLAMVAAFASWHLIEKRALRLKGWSPPRPRRRARHASEQPEPDQAAVAPESARLAVATLDAG